ncbi:acetyl-CoA carboxylase biotin carboxyl carrier protein [Micromonospora polyrhachis]|uniref:Biotin carboxyl carrier protein of acetyl-CoA carboxylase n=1 Tax=Micromonospora polyrhachis TaxID=1282883 RepID=A0A7W7SW13_9ACTN|nr:acetyl-CoA carboxylase biotin carboxyl carrier protein [Micromonospora polyrhachis]MBB4961974.1 acetyl-CoA carboxylase biotin carboxyl carrier protein [Micromonospora polyrhachis]
MSSEPAGGELLVQLRQQARQLVAEVAGPLRRLSMRSGDAVVEIEWHAAGAMPVPAAAGSAPLAVPEAQAHTEGRAMVVSPIVGTFYRAPEPGAAPFVEVGDVVEAGQVIGIVEAMKLMNHITAEQAGKVAEVLVRDGEPVEFEQALVALVPA